MTLKDKLQLLLQEFTNLKNKIKTFIQAKDNALKQKDQTITQITQQKQETAHKLELSVKENSENEKVLEQLLKEFKELAETLA
jgi:ABC-type transporter Mla subunit MlaD